MANATSNWDFGSINSGFSEFIRENHGGVYRDFTNGGHALSAGSENAGGTTGSVIRVQDGQIYNDGDIFTVRSDAGTLARASITTDGAVANLLNIYSLDPVNSNTVTHTHDHAAGYSIESADNVSLTIGGNANTGAVNIGTGGIRTVTLGSVASNVNLNAATFQATSPTWIENATISWKHPGQIADMTVNAAGGLAVLTADDLIQGYHYIGAAGGAVALTMPDTADVVNALVAAGVTPVAGTILPLTIVQNTDANNLTITAGANGTVVGTAVVASNTAQIRTVFTAAGTMTHYSIVE